MSAAPSDRPFYLGTGDTSTFTTYHAPESAEASGVGIVLCPPFGVEDQMSTRPRRTWARHLAAEGHAVLRIDFAGTGDSAGNPRDPDRLGAWVGSVRDAVAWLRTTGGCTRVVIVGIGLGGLVAGEALRRGVTVDGVALWAVHAQGRRYLRELKTFGRMEASASYELSEAELEAVPDGALVVAGYLLTAETLAAIEAVRLDDLPELHDLPALLLGRDAMAADARLVAGFGNAGAAVTSLPGEGYAAMMLEPHLSQAPTAVFAEVDRWLATSVAHHPPAERNGVDAPTPPPTSDALRLTVDGTELVESPLALPHHFGDMRAIVTEPAATAGTGATAPRVCAVLLNVGGQRRTGPNRMWVESARRWAARGVVTLRLDIAGLGDADIAGADWAERDDFSVYTPEFVDQVNAALDAADARGFHGRYVLGGVCSGAYWAFQAALTDTRVATAVLVNPSALLYTPMLETTRQARRAQKLTQGRIWARLRRRQIPTREVLRVLGALARFPLMWFRGRFGKDPLDKVLDGLRERDSRLLMIFTPHEQVYEEMRREGRIERLDRWPNVDIRELPGEGFAHTLQPLPLQHYVNAMLDEAVLAEVKRLPEASGAPATLQHR
ncbi:alpha/beta fold hydrolase [Conexibacter woesei]|uniref:alpha/beta fold hydrolase n=1 Tax=Conexibacter woesei TaxID=191495 RepID=UPI0004078284|nr:alpha/beta fold hydrolase [Conexibacter woesei]